MRWSGIVQSSWQSTIRKPFRQFRSSGLAVGLARAEAVEVASVTVEPGGAAQYLLWHHSAALPPTW